MSDVIGLGNKPMAAPRPPFRLTLMWQRHAVGHLLEMSLFQDPLPFPRPVCWFARSLARKCHLTSAFPTARPAKVLMGAPRDGVRQVAKILGIFPDCLLLGNVDAEN